MPIEKDKFTIKSIYKIIKEQVYPLDEIARRGAYDTIVRVLATKVSIQSIDTILKNNPGLTAEEVEKYKKDKKRIRK